LPVVGHVPHLVGAAAASDKGQKSLEHAHGLFLACSREEARLRKEIAAMIRAGALADDTLNATSGWRFEVKALDSYDPDKATALFRKLVANGTWVVPTLVCRRNWASLHDEDFLNDPRKGYLPLTVRSTWFHTVKAGRVRFPLFGNIELSAQDIENMKRLYAGHLRLVHAMHQAGVKMMAGTDSPVPYCFPGSGLLDELELLVQAGLRPRDALAMATIRPAEFLGRLDDFGSIARGKYADLVLLAANPLTDIRNLRKIEGVIVAGRYYDRDAVRLLATGRRP
ncbi:MAG: amidohydrolase family protein, partial [Gemmataceae bacterium]|nr:amidohydrolase family protein [Gemmataceae bacterium]